MSSVQSVGIPQWEVDDLNAMSSKGELNGIPPYVLAGMAQNESGGEVNGAGVNSSGHGGYFGASTSQISPSLLESASQSSFDSQAQTTSAILSNYNSPAGALGDAAIWNVGAKGSNNGNNWQASPDAVAASNLYPGSNLRGTAAVGASKGGAAPSSSSSSNSGGLKPGNLVPNLYPGGNWDPLNWLTGTSEVNAVWKAAFPFILVGTGILIMLVGLFITFRGGGDKITLNQAPQTNNPPPPKKSMGKEAEDAGEDAAVVAAA